MSDVKVWDAPRIGRNDGMSVEAKCYQRVVIWADHLAEVERLTKERDEARAARDLWYARATALGWPTFEQAEAARQAGPAGEGEK